MICLLIKEAEGGVKKKMKRTEICWKRKEKGKKRGFSPPYHFIFSQVEKKTAINSVVLTLDTLTRPILSCKIAKLLCQYERIALITAYQPRRRLISFVYVYNMCG